MVCSFLARRATVSRVDTLLYKKAGANAGKRANFRAKTGAVIEAGSCVALSFAGIIQIRYGGYLSPGTCPGPLASRESITAKTTYGGFGKWL